LKGLNLTKRESTGGASNFSWCEGKDGGQMRSRPDDRALDTLRGIEMKQSEEARKMMADRHADQVRAQIRRIEEESEMRKPRPSDVSEIRSSDRH